MHPVWLFEAKHMSSVKAADRMEGMEGGKDDRVEQFHDHDLLGMRIPFEARPMKNGCHMGKHGYTLRSKTGAVICLGQQMLVICEQILGFLVVLT